MAEIILENERFRLVVGENCIVRSLVLQENGEECLEAGEEISLFSVTQERPFNNEVKLAHPNRRITCQSESINSVPFAMAATLAAGDIDLVSWFPPFDPRIEGIMGRVQLVYDDISREHLDPDGYRMEAHMKDGTVVPGEKLTYEALTYEGIEKRFLKTVALRLGQERAEALRDMILDLEAVEDMGQLTDRFSVQ